YRAGAAGHGLADPGGRVWDGGGGFERCAHAHRSPSAAECLVSFSARGGGYPDNFAAPGAGAACENVRFAGGAVGSEGGAVDRGGSRLLSVCEAAARVCRGRGRGALADPNARAACGEYSRRSTAKIGCATWRGSWNF